MSITPLPQGAHAFPIELPRHAFSLRDVARAGDIWRACQEVAVLASTAVGWPPQRFREESAAFVMRKMIVVHHHEARYGEPLRSATWVHGFQRKIFSTREIQLSGDARPIASATQGWAHVRFVDPQLTIAPASPSLIDAFPPIDQDQALKLPTYAPLDPRPWPTFAFEPWHVFMDPLGHLNHPGYVDACDEALSRGLEARGIPPSDLVPIAEQLTFLRALRADQHARVETEIIGECEGALVLAQRVFAKAKGARDAEEFLCARSLSVRTLARDPARLRAFL